MSKLQRGQVAVVTGAATGIGFALASAFARRGLRVALADVDPNTLRATVAKLTGQGATAIGVPTDVSDRNAVRALKDEVLAKFGAVDIICNNAGVYYNVKPIWTKDLDEWRRLFEINYWGVVHGIHEFVPLLVKQGRGHVVNTASMSGLSSVPGMADYGSAKHAVVALSEILRNDLDLAGVEGVGVTLLCPALVKTAMGDFAVSVTAAQQTEVDRRAIGSGPTSSNPALDPDDLAEAAMRGIEAGHLYVTPTPNSKERFTKRVQPILDAFDSQA